MIAFSSNSFTQTDSQQTEFAPPSSCKEFKAAFGKLDAQGIWSEDLKECWISVTPHDVPTLTYRQLILSSDGMMMVFNSFGEGASEKNTAAREYFFFPRTKNEISLVSNESKKQFQVILPNQKKLSFKYDDVDLQGLESGKVKVASTVEPSNRGGLEILSYDGIYMDCGFQIGQNPTANPFRFCQIMDAKKNICRLQNQQIFDYTESGDPILKSDDDVKELVHRLCPRIEWN